MPKQVKNANEESIRNTRIHYMQPTVLVIRQHAEDMVWEVGMIESQSIVIFLYHGYRSIIPTSIGKQEY